MRYGLVVLSDTFSRYYLTGETFVRFIFLGRSSSLVGGSSDCRRLFCDAAVPIVYLREGVSSLESLIPLTFRERSSSPDSSA